MGESIGLYIIIFLWSVLEILCVNLLFKHFMVLSHKQSGRSVQIVKWLIFFLIVGGYAYSINNNLGPAKIALEILMFIKTAVLLSCYYKLKIRNATFVIFFVSFVSFIGTNIYLLIPQIDLNIGHEESYFTELVGAIFTFCLILGLHIFQRKNIICFWISELSTFDFLLFSVVLYTVGVWEVGALMVIDIPKRFKLLYVIMIVSIIIMIIRTIIITNRKNSLENINDLLEEQMIQTTEYYKQLIEKDNQLKKFRHDIKNLLIGLYSMVKENKNEKALEYLGELEDICNQSKPRYDTGNFIADAILDTKGKKAEQLNIRLDLEGFIPAEKVKDVDMVIVLSNLIDNAIEACEKIDGNKVISIKSILKKNMWILQVENPSVPVYIFNNLSQTSKAEKEIHGFGLVNIKRTAQKYDGDMQLKYEEGVFRSITSFKF